MDFKRGVYTSEFWVAVLTFAVGMVARVAGSEFPTEAFIVVGTYVISRGLTKLGK